MTWLGTSSGSPSVERNVSCTVVQTPTASFLVDCGEGTHRQLQQASIDPAKIDGVFITHLHGDHCFGLATTLMMIDSAKAESWEAVNSASTSPLTRGAGLSSSSGRGSTSGQTASGSMPSSSGSSQPPRPPVTRVYGPPGLGELLRVSLAMTCDLESFKTRFEVTELVVQPGDARDAAQLACGLQGGVLDDLDLGSKGDMQRLQRRHASTRTSESSPAVINHGALIAEGGAMWEACTGSSTSKSSSGPLDSKMLLSIRRQASQSVFDDPELKVSSIPLAYMFVVLLLVLCYLIVFPRILYPILVLKYYEIRCIESSIGLIVRS